MSVSLKSPLMVISVGSSEAAPVFVRVTVCVLLELPYIWLENVSEAGAAVAVVMASEAVHSGFAQMPRP